MSLSSCNGIAKATELSFKLLLPQGALGRRGERVRREGRWGLQGGGGGSLSSAQTVPLGRLTSPKRRGFPCPAPPSLCRRIPEPHCWSGNPHGVSQTCLVERAHLLLCSRRGGTRAFLRNVSRGLLYTDPAFVGMPSEALAAAQTSLGLYHGNTSFSCKIGVYGKRSLHSEISILKNAFEKKASLCFKMSPPPPCPAS